MAAAAYTSLWAGEQNRPDLGLRILKADQPHAVYIIVLCMARYQHVQMDFKAGSACGNRQRLIPGSRRIVLSYRRYFSKKTVCPDIRVHQCTGAENPYTAGGTQPALCTLYSCNDPGAPSGQNEVTVNEYRRTDNIYTVSSSALAISDRHHQPDKGQICREKRSAAAASPTMTLLNF